MARPKSNNEEKMIKIKIIPLSNDYQQVNYVKIYTGEFINARMLPFDKPVLVTKKELEALERMRYITSKKEKITPEEIMDKYKVSKQMAIKMIEEGIDSSKVKKPRHFEIIRL